MIAGVISFSPSQATPSNGSANVFRADRARYSPASTSSNANVPSSPVVVVSTCLAVRVEQLDGHAGEAELPGSTSPGVPPPGLKSRQTTPVDPALQRLGFDRLHRVAGTSLGGSPSGRGATCRRLQRRLQRRSPFGVPVIVGVDGCASESTPGGLKASLTTGSRR
jgi:hypothetical protein